MLDRRNAARVTVAVLVLAALVFTGSSAAASAAELTISSPTGGSRSANATPLITGTTSEVEILPVNVYVFAGSGTGGTELQKLSATPALGAWEAQVAELPSGEFTVIAEQTNGASEKSFSPAVTFVVDRTPPTVSISVNPTPVGTSTPFLSGGAGNAFGDEAGVKVTVYHGGSVGGSVAEEVEVNRSGGSWSHTTGGLSDGEYTAQAVQYDNLGNRGESTADTFVIDTHPPGVSLEEVASPTKNTTPTFSGGAGTESGDGSTVFVVLKKAGGGTVEKSVGVSGGKWSYTAPSLSDGEYTVQVYQEDWAKNLGTAGPRSFTVDTHAPAVSIEQVKSPTKNPTPTLAGGAGSGSTDGANVTVVVRNAANAVVESPSFARSGSSWSHTTGHLADGAYTAQASQESTTGVVSFSSGMSFTVDTTPPAVTIDPVKSPTSNPTPTFGGGAGTAAGDHSSVAVVVRRSSDSTVVSQNLSVGVSAGRWSYTPSALAPTSYTVTATQEDAAGNVGTTTPATFTVDTHKPAVSLKTVPTPTNNATPTLSGGAGAEADDGANVLVVVHEGTSVAGKAVETTSVPRSGAAWSHTTAKLADGTYTAQASQTSENGLTGESAPSTFAVDTLAPTVTIAPITAPPSNQTPTISGTAGSAPIDILFVKVQLFAGEGAFGKAVEVPVVSGKWSYTPKEPLPDNSYTVTAVQEDKAGNKGSAGPVAFVIATNAPHVTFEPVGSPTRNRTPILGGNAGVETVDEHTVSVAIYAGNAIEVGTPVQSNPKVAVEAGKWSFAATSLADGVYTAVVQQKNKANDVAESVRLFRIDTTPPVVTITQPFNGAIVTVAQPTFAGVAGAGLGDLPTVTLRIYSGPAAVGAPLNTLTLSTAGGAWSSASAGPTLPNGIYTAVVEQGDEAGNTATSTSAFAVNLPPVVATTPPVASFRWFPAAPHVGETISFVSTSNSGSSPIESYAWSPTGSPTLTAGGPVMTTSFATAGAHVVRLQVRDANGTTSTVAETVQVTQSSAQLMQPFPVVRIAGSAKASSVTISLFTVLAPAGARVSISCRGSGCPTKAQSLLASAHGRHHSGTVLITFRRFERSFGVGAVLEVRVSRVGQIGKYVRFSVRRGKLPTRVDKCLSPAGVKPMNCPSS